VRSSTLFVVAAALAIGLAACAHPQARTQPVREPLDVPLPPARTIAPPPPEEPPAVEAQPPDVSNPKPARPRPAPPRTEPAQPPVAPPPSQPQTLPPAAGTLQTTPPAGQGEMVRNIRDVLARARRDLGGIVYERLNADGKAQFDTAKRFADQAEQALKDMNLVFAQTLADKAATLAHSLAGRL
jgi:type IV secretory pathway VirB10-like protein